MLPRAVRGGQGLAFNVLTRAMTRAAAQDMQVVHDEENMEFYIKLGEGAYPLVHYRHKLTVHRCLMVL